MADAHVMGVDFDPCLKPPFSTFECGDLGRCICDNYGRTIVIENRHVGFVDELCDVMNENKERLVKAWQR